MLPFFHMGFVGKCVRGNLIIKILNLDGEGIGPNSRLRDHGKIC